MDSEGIELSQAVVIHDEGGVDALKLSGALEAITDSAPIGLCELDQRINSFLHDFLQRNTENNAKSIMQESRIKNLLSSSVSRAITETIPLYPQERDISEFIRSMGIKPVNRFLVMKTDGIELITHQHILNYIASSGKIEDVMIMNIQGDRVPEIERTCTIQQAIKIMEEKHTSCLLVQWNAEEKRKYTRTKTDQYPPVVTQNQINILLLQTLMEDGYIEKEVPEEPVNRYRTALDDLEDEELEDSLEDNMNEKEDADVIIDSNQISPVKSNQSLTPPQSTSSGLQLTSSQNGNDVNCAKEKQKRKKKRSTRRVILKTVNNVFVVFVMWVAQILDIVLCFCFLSDIYNYLKSPFFMYLSCLFIIEDALNIVGDSWITKSGKRRVIINLIDIFLIVSSIIYIYISFSSERVSRIIGSLIVLLKFIRSYKLVIYQKNTLSTYFRKKFNRNRNQLGDTSLDMTFITGHIIAMSWPGSNIDSMWRNNIVDVESFLNHHFGGNYWVINLCAEKSYSKSGVRPFGNRFTKYSIRDHNACSLTQMCSIIDQCQEWFSRDPSNVVAIHCKGGKGRTGMIVSCLLLKMGVQIRPEDALDLFAARRTTTNKEYRIKEQRVSSPSQNRYVFYYNYILENGMPPPKPLMLKGFVVPNFQDMNSSRYQYLIRIYDIHYIPRLEEQDEGTWGDCLRTMNLLLVKRGEEESSQTQGTAHETWTLRSEIPLYLSQDGSSRLSFMEGEKEIILQGDVRIELIVSGSMTATLGFVWFNTSFITKRDFYFQDYEIDDCSAALDRNLYIRMLVDGPQLNGIADLTKLPQIRLDIKKSGVITESPGLSDTSNSSSKHSLFNRTYTPSVASRASRGESSMSSRASRGEASLIEGVSFRNNRISRNSSGNKLQSKPSSNISDLELFERAKMECELTEEERLERESLFASLTPDERKKMEQYRKMCEEANDIFKSIRMSERNTLSQPRTDDLDLSMIPQSLPTLESESEEGESDGVLSLEIMEEEEEEEIGIDMSPSRSHLHSSGFKGMSLPSLLPEPKEEGVFIPMQNGQSRYSHASLRLQQQEIISIPDLSSDSD